MLNVMPFRMQKSTIIKFTVLTLMISALSSCGVKYKRIDLKPNEFENGWIEKYGSHTYYCAQSSGAHSGSKLSTSGVTSFEYRQQTFFYIDVYDEYAKKTPKIIINTESGMLPNGECPKDLVKLTHGDSVFIPIHGSSFLIGGYGLLTCSYTFDRDVLMAQTLELIFNADYTDCKVPPLKLYHNIDSGYYGVPLL